MPISGKQKSWGVCKKQRRAGPAGDREALKSGLQVRAVSNPQFVGALRTVGYRPKLPEFVLVLTRCLTGRSARIAYPANRAR
jgi:hypothetical protein